MSSDCVFCKIVHGHIPCHPVYLDDQLLAFLDINPLSEGHCLLIPKQHFSRFDHCPADLVAALSCRLGPLARAIVAAVGAQGYNLLVNNGPCAGQIVEHVHFHIVPRSPDDKVFTHHPQIKYPPGRLQQLAQQIKTLLPSA